MTDWPAGVEWDDGGNAARGIVIGAALGAATWAAIAAAIITARPIRRRHG